MGLEQIQEIGYTYKMSLTNSETYNMSPVQYISPATSYLVVRMGRKQLKVSEVQ